ncbi:tail fiber domain-containing protein [Flavobacterium sp.]|uniref:tail fiber domain-containing protein n=1 Tax=Flavobacterium sp. TaxID=239 RepID=UPI0035277DD2
MRAKLLQIVFLISVNCCFAQVGINTTNPNAQLEIQSSNQATPANTDGLIIPRVDTFPSVNPTAAQQGMIVYLTTVIGTNESGFYYWDNPSTTWIPIANNSKNAWKTTGNLGTDATINYIGTNDNQDVVFKRNSISSGFIGISNTSFGNNSMTNATAGTNNVALGNTALQNNTSGSRNVAVGFESLRNNTTGTDNIAVGRRTLNDNLDGNNNIAIGTSSLFNNTSGFQNVAIGHQSTSNNSTGQNNIGLGVATLNGNSTGSRNTAIGSFALNVSNNGNQNTGLGSNTQTIGPSNLNLTNATAIGSNALVQQDNSMVLGSINGVNTATASVNVGIGTTTPQDRLHVVGNIRMVDGNQAAGRVLTSDANGTATWTNPSTISSGTLDQAYDFGGAGNGRTITADTGPFQVDGTDGILSTGSFGTGTLAPSGAGIRMLWYPRKYAFRAGQVTNTSWDDANIGHGSAAFGVSTLASGGSSFACGLSSVASGLFSFAFGSGATSSGTYSFAGSHATASGEGSFAFGLGSLASASHSFALGFDITASANYSTAFGYTTLASGFYSTAFGYSSRATAHSSTAFGYGSSAIGVSTTAFGRVTTASGYISTAFGDETIASGSRSTTFGKNTIASGYISTAFGDSNTAPSSGETVIGIGATNYTPSLNGDTQFRAANATDRLFVIGNAIDANMSNSVDDTERSDAMVVLKNGNTGIGSSAPQDKLHVVGNIRMVDGNEAAGKILTSDANGTATWQNASANSWSITGNNNTTVANNFIGTTNLQSLAFRTVNVERMRITSFGNVGIGTTAPGGQFELSLNEGRKPTSNTWTIPSDARLKTVNGAYQKGLNDILKLKPIRYNYINTEKRTFEPKVLQKEAYGFLAQEVKEIFPEAVGLDADGYYNFDLHPILIAYTNAIKELNTTIEDQKDKIQSLEDKLKTLEEKFNSLVTKLNN